MNAALIAARLMRDAGLGDAAIDGVAHKFFVAVAPAWQRWGVARGSRAISAGLTWTGSATMRRTSSRAEPTPACAAASPT